MTIKYTPAIVEKKGDRGTVSYFPARKDQDGHITERPLKLSNNGFTYPHIAGDLAQKFADAGNEGKDCLGVPA